MRRAMFALLLAGSAHAQGDQAVVRAPNELSVTGLKQLYAPSEPIKLGVVVPRRHVLRARTEVTLTRGGKAGAPVFQELRDYDRYTDVQKLNFRITLPEAERKGQLALLVRVRGLRTRGEGTPAESFEETLTYRLRFAEGEGPVAVQASRRLEGKVYFGHDSALLDAKGQKTVAGWARSLKAQLAEVAQVRVEGHADQTGGSNYNLGLSRRRAESVRQALIAAGLPGGRITVVGWGFERPEVDAPEKNQRLNRRAELVWFPKGG